jgi:asparagine synthase (glutamine-hydrolysing)
MCGILGTIDRSFDQSMLELIQHRGPDGSGVSHMRVGGHHVTLGHCRLAIMDPSPSGHQPMSTSCGSYTITFNGEIYNHLELRNDLGEQEFCGHSDTETILHCLARNGIGAVAQFNGIFAFGLVDAQYGKLFLARDRFGVKPLYYWADAHGFAFSSEIRALRSLVDASIDTAALAELLRLRYLPSPDTLFKGIRKVRPGHIVEVDLRSPQLSLREYPFFDPVPIEAAPSSQAQAIGQYGFLLEQAVKRQLLSDVEVGLLLSSGIDSALVAHYAQKHAPYRMKAFTVGFRDRDETDEVADAAETARAIGLEHYDVRVGFPEFLEILPRIEAIVEEPLATTSVVPMFYLSQLAAGHVKVVLSGQGADEAMGGYRRYRGELLRRFVPLRAVPILTRAARLLAVSNDAVCRGLASAGEQDDVLRFLNVYTVFTPDQIHSLIGEAERLAVERIRYFFDLLLCSTQRHSGARMMSLDLRMNLADDLLLYTDKITMHHSLECRVPLLDLDLIRYAEGLPLRYRCRFFRGKVLHRQFARNVLPGPVIRRKKKGFLSPTKRWFKQANVIKDILLDSRSCFSVYFDRCAVAAVIDEHAAGMDRERQLFLLLSLYYWMEAWLRAPKSELRSNRSAHLTCHDVLVPPRRGVGERLGLTEL